MNHQPDQSRDDIFAWPDGTYCYRRELEEMTHMSDDWCVYYVDTPEFEEFCEAESAVF